MARETRKEEGSAGAAWDGSGLIGFLKSPLRYGEGAPMKFAGDWVSMAGALLFFVSVLFLPWIKVSISILGVEATSAQFGLFESPWWVWGLLIALGSVLLGGIWFVQTRGLLTLSVGIFTWAFAVIFWIGVWKKIESIIGPILRLARSLPLVGTLVGDILETLTKEALNVSVSWGYVLFVVAGVFLVVGGLLRYFLVPVEN